MWRAAWSGKWGRVGLGVGVATTFLLGLTGVGAVSAESVLEHFDEEEQPSRRGGTLFLLPFDLDGDGAEDLLLSHTQSWGLAGGYWLVYRSTGEGFRHLGGLLLHPSAYRLDPEQARIQVWGRHAAVEGVSVTYAVGEETLTVESQEGPLKSFVEVDGKLEENPRFTELSSGLAEWAGQHRGLIRKVSFPQLLEVTGDPTKTPLDRTFVRFDDGEPIDSAEAQRLLDVLAAQVARPEVEAARPPADRYRWIPMQRFELPREDSGTVNLLLPGGEALEPRFDRRESLEISAPGSSGPFLHVPECAGAGCLAEAVGLGTFALGTSGEAAVAIFARHTTGSRWTDEDVETWYFCAVGPGGEKRRISGCYSAASDVSKLALTRVPPARWRYLQPELDEELPGTYSATQPLLIDLEEDGTAEILLWRRHFKAKPAETSGAEDDGAGFEMTREEMAVLRYDTESRSFDGPTPVDVEAPPENWWQNSIPVWDRGADAWPVKAAEEKTRRDDP